ncbi:MAG: O-methyltransferase [Firmicutes bacterium]|nr:O-methyltransferase [Bacillota bacterium]
MQGLIKEMEHYAQENNVPIIQKESIVYIMKYIKEHNIKSILEIGSAIGYSAILMASVSDDIKLTTIERDQTRYMECLKNIKKSEMEKKITVLYQDALEVNLTGVSYDLIFIDAAKGQNINFFEKYKNFLNEGGTIITDNMDFHGMVGKSSEIESKNLRELVQKIENYIEYLKNNDEFNTEFLSIGDGLSVSTRKED